MQLIIIIIIEFSTISNVRIRTIGEGATEQESGVSLAAMLFSSVGLIFEAGIELHQDEDLMPKNNSNLISSHLLIENQINLICG